MLSVQVTFEAADDLNIASFIDWLKSDTPPRARLAGYSTYGEFSKAKPVAKKKRRKTAAKARK